MMGWRPNDGNECHHDGYCKDCEHNGVKGMNEEKYNRMEILLKAAFDILKKTRRITVCVELPCNYCGLG